jgi:hypothetical protein
MTSTAGRPDCSFKIRDTIQSVGVVIQQAARSERESG